LTTTYCPITAACGPTMLPNTPTQCPVDPTRCPLDASGVCVPVP
jgi:hypothetical protein